jgi:anti-sigma-K factor RskA
MSSLHDEQALAAAYVLGALDLSERRAFEAHVAGCPICEQEVRSLQRVADALARSVPQRTPQPEVRDRVLAAVTGRSSSKVSGPTSKIGPYSANVGWLALAASVLLVVGLAAYAIQLQGRLATVEGRLEDARTTMAVLAAPDLTRIDLAGQPPAPRATARALWSRNRGMVFTTAGLPPPPAGRVYQVWVVTAQAPVSAGLLVPDPSGRATAVFDTPANIADPVAVAVTLEPAGGVASPSGEKYLIGTPAPAL